MNAKRFSWYSEMQAIMRDYCEQLYVSELGNLEDNKLPETDNLSG